MGLVVVVVVVVLAAWAPVEKNNFPAKKIQIETPSKKRAEKFYSGLVQNKLQKEYGELDVLWV